MWGFKGTVHVWEAGSGRRLLTYNGHRTAVKAVAWSPDGSRVASADGYNLDESTVQIWETDSGRCLHTYDGHFDDIEALAWSPDGSRVAFAASGYDDDHTHYGYTVQVWEADSGRCLLTYDGHFSNINALAWSPDGTRIASGAHNGVVVVWQAG
jgi:WD40 repeat protein